MNNEISLLSWQQEAMVNWVSNNQKGSIKAPTGAGKTYLGLYLLQNSEYLPALIVVPSRSLKDQWIEKIHNYYPNFDVSVIGDGRNDPIRDVTVGIINSVREQNLSVTTLILDECHHYHQIAPKNFQVWDKVAYKYVLGLSATPIPEDMKKSSFDAKCPLVYSYELQHAIAAGDLLKPRIAMKGTSLEDNEKVSYDKLCEQINAMGVRVYRFADAPLEFKRLVMARNNILFDSKKKLDMLLSLISTERFSKAIVFTERISQIEEIVENLNKMLSVNIFSLHSKMKKQKQEENLAGFKQTDNGVLVMGKAFEEGMDIPEVDLVILYSYNKTKRESLQRIGRALHNKQKTTRVFVLFYQWTKEFRTAKRIMNIFS